MFQNLRNGSKIYILHKSEPKVEVGEVVNISPINQNFTTQYNIMKYVVDIKVKIDDRELEFQKLPTDASTADFNGVYISDNKDNIINEISILKINSEKIVNNIETHKDIIKKCELLLTDLSPEIKRDAERLKEFNNMKTEISDLKTNMNDIKNMLSKILKTKKEE